MVLVFYIFCSNDNIIVYLAFSWGETRGGEITLYPSFGYRMIGLTRKKGERMKVWIKAGVIIFYVLIYSFLRKRMRRDFIKFFKAMMLLMIFVLSLLPEAIIIKQLGLAFRADTLILWMAGIEAIDAWDEYEREKNNYKKYRRSKVNRNGKTKKETRI